VSRETPNAAGANPAAAMSGAGQPGDGDAVGVEVNQPPDGVGVAPLIYWVRFQIFF
jgi:hypothetical protein